MRFLPVLLAACAVLVAQPARSLYIDELSGEAGVVVGSEGALAHLRFLQEDNSTTPTPTTATPTPTTATPTPTTATPTPTTATPTPTTETPTETPTTETPTETPVATTETPSATTATPESTTETPTTTTATPESTTETPTSTPTTTETPASTSSSASASTSGDGQTDGSAGSSSASTGGSESGSKMSTGAVIGIVVGIIAAVAIIAFLVMFVMRRRRDNDEDPLSPFELSMDKGYSATPGFASQDTYNPRGNAASAAALAARDNQLETGSLSANTPGTEQAAAAGIGYTQFYEQQTSPEHANNGHQYQAQYTTQSSNDSYAQEATHPSNSTNLWMSAMEPKENDTYLSAQSADDKSEQSSRNSYDRGLTGDNDASSEISGASDLNSGKDFPDYEEHRSSRGSYEL